jgi:hypothetical protein
MKPEAVRIPVMTGLRAVRVLAFVGVVVDCANGHRCVANDAEKGGFCRCISSTGFRSPRQQALLFITLRHHSEGVPDKHARTASQHDSRYDRARLRDTGLTHLPCSSHSKASGNVLLWRQPNRAVAVAQPEL